MDRCSSADWRAPASACSSDRAPGQHSRPRCGSDWQGPDRPSRFRPDTALVDGGAGGLGFLSSTAKDRKLNSADLAQLLQRENTAASAAMKPEVKALLDEAFTVGDKAQKLKASFSDDEWRKIRLAPMAVTFYVATSSPSGLRGLPKEVVASGEAMKALAKDALRTSLVDVAFSGYDAKLELEGDDGLDEKAPRSSALGIVQAAMATVRAKSRVDAKSFGDTLVALSRQVAEASKEGGFLGIGGTLVSKDEEHAIAELTAAVSGNVAGV